MHSLQKSKYSLPFNIQVWVQLYVICHIRWYTSCSPILNWKTSLPIRGKKNLSKQLLGTNMIMHHISIMHGNLFHNFFPFKMPQLFLAHSILIWNAKNKANQHIRNIKMCLHGPAWLNFNPPILKQRTKRSKMFIATIIIQKGKYQCKLRKYVKLKIQSHIRLYHHAFFYHQTSK